VAFGRTGDRHGPERLPRRGRRGFPSGASPLFAGKGGTRAWSRRGPQGTVRRPWARSKEGARQGLALTRMARTCPGCGTPMDYEARSTTVLTGNCGSCGHQLTIVEGLADPGRAGPSPGDGSLPPEGNLGPRRDSLASVAPDAPPCPSCGASLTFKPSGGGGIEATCSGCGAVSSYVPAGAHDRPYRPRSAARPERWAGGSPGFRPPSARPCRECGGPLRFSTAPDGTISGECTSCGNRFTLPARREYDRGRAPGGRFDRGPPRGNFRERGPYRPYPGPRRGGFRRRDPRDDRDSDESPRRRKRRE
jgi:hypothetical protein